MELVSLAPDFEGRKGFCPECGAEVRWAKPVPQHKTSRTRIAIAAAVGLLAAFVLFTVVAESRYQQHGTMIARNGGELFYTSRVQKAEAERLSDYLVKCGFFNGDRKSVQIDREGRWYRFRMIVKKGIETDPQNIAVMKAFITDLSRDVFGGLPVEIHLCDDHFNTLKTVVNPTVN